MGGEFPAEGMELTHLLVVSDADRARDFYRDVLGAQEFRRLRIWALWNRLPRVAAKQLIAQ